MMKFFQFSRINYIQFLLISAILFSLIFAQEEINSFKPENQKLWTKAKEISKNIIIIDCHSHDLFKPKGKKFPKQVNFEMTQNSGINGIVQSFPISARKKENPKKHIINEIKKYNSEKNKRYIQANTSDELKSSISSTKLKLLFGLEYFYGMFDGDINSVKDYYDLGVRSVCLFNGGLDTLYKNYKDNFDMTLFGKNLVSQMNDFGIACDLSHLPDEVRYTFINFGKAPAYISHANVRSIVDAKFNLSEKTLKALIKKKGVVCLTFYSEYVSSKCLAESKKIKNPFERPRASLEEFIDHIDYIKNKFGINNICIGSDYGGTGRFGPKELETIEGFQMIIYHLLKRSYTEDEIKKIMGLNFINYLERVEKYSTTSLKN